MLRSAIAAAALFAWTGFAAAAEIRTYDQAAFEAAAKDGKPIVVMISAPWCPTCKAQKPVIDALAADPRFAELQIFDVDFDSRKDVVRQLEARSQSTLIAFDGATETARSVGVTDPAAIEDLFESAL